ncbi:MAG: S26 family signal peptidase [Pedobacter sp.]|nr:MAG: S26 family signal peptidase [Pedobacter sp.]
MNNEYKSKFQPIKEIYEFIKSFITAIIIAFLFRSLAYDPYHIPSGSMKPNLIEGDYIFVSKFTYGYSRYSFPFGLNIFYLPNHQTLYLKKLKKN